MTREPVDGLQSADVRSSAPAGPDGTSGLWVPKLELEVGRTAHCKDSEPGLEPGWALRCKGLLVSDELRHLEWFKDEDGSRLL